MWKCLSIVCGCLLFLGEPILALSAKDPRNKLVEIPQPSLVAASPYVVDGLALGGHVKSGNQAYQPYQCRPSDQFSGFIWCHEEHTTPDNTVMRSHSILQSQDGTAYYVDSYFQPAFFDPNDIQNEIDRMSSEFRRQARIIQMPKREGLPSAVMAIWGAIQLEPLKPDEISVVASGESPAGILVSFLGDEERSAKAGVPVYRLAGGAGFLWAATFDQNGRGVLRYLAIDASKIESRQVASNQPAPAPTLHLEFGNQTTSSQGPANPAASNQPAPAPTLSLEFGNQTTSSQGPANEGADRQRNEVQQLETISEVAIAIFVLLCGLAVGAFLRTKRVRG